jgi:hypothetical protein
VSEGKEITAVGGNSCFIKRKFHSGIGREGADIVEV